MWNGAGVGVVNQSIVGVKKIDLEIVVWEGVLYWFGVEAEEKLGGEEVDVVEGEGEGT